MKRLFTQFSFPLRDSEPRRAGDARIDPRRRRAGLCAARMRTAPPSTIRTCSSRAWSAMARRRRARSRRAGTRTSFSIPATDGAVLPILHLNGYKIANPTVLARISRDELDAAASADTATRRISSKAMSQRRCTSAWPRRSTELSRHPAYPDAGTRDGIATERPLWPMIVLRSPKGWTGPKEVDGRKTEGSWRAIRCRWARCTRTPST